MSDLVRLLFPMILNDTEKEELERRAYNKIVISKKAIKDVIMSSECCKIELWKWRFSFSVQYTHIRPTAYDDLGTNDTKINSNLHSVPKALTHPMYPLKLYECVTEV